MTAPLEFDLVREEYPDRWHRARHGAEAALVERVAWDGWIVTLPDGDPWLVRLRSDHGAFLGTCKAPPDAEREHDHCPGNEWHDGPCAHLCAIRYADWCNREGIERITDTRGQQIVIHDEAEVHAERVDSAVERAGRGVARADGGGIR
jgi:hypothetical protein